MKSISFNKTLSFTKSSIEIRYNGILPNDNVDLDKIEILLEDFINNHRHDNMIENVTIVRTILKDCKEKLLVIFIGMIKVQSLLSMLILIYFYMIICQILYS